MIKFRMYERELTGGGVWQDHDCVDRFEEYDINLDNHGLGRTPSNETSPHDYIHIFATNECGNIIEQRVLDFFNIPVNFPITFFTRKVPFTSEFRCGFSLKTYETFNSTYYDQAIMTRNMFSGLYDHINLSGNFTNTGEFEGQGHRVRQLRPGHKGPGRPAADQDRVRGRRAPGHREGRRRAVEGPSRALVVDWVRSASASPTPSTKRSRGAP